jgi:hypothetical protein
MKDALLAPSLLLVAMLASSPRLEAGSRLAGCPNPKTLSSTLKTIAKSDWEGISVASLRSVWPAELGESDCTNGLCGTLKREDHIINDECQCCELFHFDLQRVQIGVADKPTFFAIGIYYTSNSLSEPVDAAKILAQSIGLSDGDAATIGRKGNKSYEFYWEVDGGSRPQFSLLQIQILRQQQLWTVYLFSSRNPK